MAGDPFKHVKAGDPLRISARIYNHTVDAARKNLSADRQPFAPPAVGQRNPSIVRIRNDSSGDRARFSVLGISGVIFAPAADGEFYAAPAVTGVVPNEDTHAHAFAVLLEPIADGQIGYAVLAGAVQCQIHVGDAAHGYARVKTSQLYFESAATGPAKILYKESGTGIKWALVNIGSAAPAPAGAMLVGAATDDVDFDGATIPIGSVTPSEYADVSSVINALGFAVASGSTVIAFYDADNDDWYGFAKPVTKTLSPVVDLQVSGLNLQLKTRGIVVLDKDAADSAWTTWHTGTDCPE